MSSDIGFATAKRFVEEGAYVLIARRCQSELDNAVAEIGKNVTGIEAGWAPIFKPCGSLQNAVNEAVGIIKKLSSKRRASHD